MPEDIKEYIKKRLSEKAKPEVIKYEVLSKGFLESDVDKIIKKQTGISTKSYIVEKFFTRELFFKLSSGFGNDQFIYIFLFLLTSSYFILGVTVGLSVILSLLFSMFLQDLFKKKKISKTMILITGIMMALCLGLIGVGLFYELSWLIIICVLLLALGNVLIGEIYSIAFGKKSEEKTDSLLLTKIGGYSLFFVVIGLVLSGFFLNKYNAFNYANNIIVLIVFGAAGLCLLISVFILLNLMETKMQIETTSIFILIKQRLRSIRKMSGQIFKNKVVMMLAIGTAITGVIQTIGITYYGVFIYQYFTNIAFNGFLNVAIMFSVPIITSLFSTYMAKALSKQYGNIPALVFGTMLIAILPLTMWLKPGIINISMAIVCSVIGGSMIGLTTGLLLSNNIEPELRHWYFQGYTLLMVLAYVVFVPLGALVAEFGSFMGLMSLQVLFAVMAIVLVLVVVPVYLSIFYIEKRKVV